jgi:hypothetical protein
MDMNSIDYDRAYNSSPLTYQDLIKQDVKRAYG